MKCEACGEEDVEEGMTDATGKIGSCTKCIAERMCLDLEKMGLLERAGEIPHEDGGTQILWRRTYSGKH